MHGIKKRVALCILSLVVFFPSLSQILPREGSGLNYRIIGVSFPAGKADKFKIEIAAGNFNSEDSFKKSIVFSATGKGGKVVAEVPSFGSQYTWRITSPSNEQHTGNNVFHHFSTLAAYNVDTGKMRL